MFSLVFAVYPLIALGFVCALKKKKKITKWPCFVSFDLGLKVTLSEGGVLRECLCPGREQHGLAVSARLACRCQGLLLRSFLSLLVGF